MIVHIDGSKDNPTRLNPPAAIPPTSLLSTPPHTCAILSRPMSRPCPCLRENILRQACMDYEPRYRRLIPPFLWPFTARGRLDECWTGSWSAPKARASSNSPPRTTHSCCSPGHVLPRFAWRRCFDVVVLQIDERDNRCEAKKLAEENAPIEFPKRTKLFSNPFWFFFLPSWNWKFPRSKLPWKLGSWILKIRSLMRWLFWREFFLEIFLERKFFLTKYRIEKILMNIELIDFWIKIFKLFSC